MTNSGQKPPAVWIDRPVENRTELEAGRFVIVGPDETELFGAHAAVIGGHAWGDEHFDKAPDLKVVARTGIGVDAVDLDAATRRGVMVTNTPEGPTVSTAEHAIALMMTVAKTLPVHADRLRNQVGGYAGLSTAMELDGLTLGLFAFGRIARRVARIASAVGMRVIAFDPVNPPVASDGVEAVDLARLLAESDVLSLHAPLVAETNGVINAQALSRMKPGVILINAARGGLVIHDDLVAALDSGQVAAAGLDVTEPEPLPPDHTLLHRLNVVVTPHIASSTVVGRQRMLTMAIDQALMALNGQTPTHLVNPQVL